METVNHPSHYGGEDNPYETIKVIEALGLLKGFCLGNALKYIMRSDKKHDDPREDVKKALWYLNYWSNYLERTCGKSPSPDPPIVQE